MRVEFIMNHVPDTAVQRVWEQLRDIVDSTTHRGSSISFTRGDDLDPEDPEG
jgi:hypothetical protein